MCKTYSYLSMFMAENQRFEGLQRDSGSLEQTMAGGYVVVRRVVLLQHKSVTSERKGRRAAAESAARASNGIRILDSSHSWGTSNTPNLDRPVRL